MQAPHRFPVAVALFLAGCTTVDGPKRSFEKGDVKVVSVRTTALIVNQDGSRSMQPGYPRTRQARLVHDGSRFVEQAPVRPLLSAGTSGSDLGQPAVDVEATIPVLTVPVSDGSAEYAPNQVHRSELGIVGSREAEGVGPLTDVIAVDDRGVAAFAMRMDWRREGEVWIANSVRVRAKVDTSVGPLPEAARRINHPEATIEFVSEVYENVAAAPAFRIDAPGVADVLAIMMRIGSWTLLPPPLIAQSRDYPSCDVYRPIGGVLDLGSPCRNRAAREAALGGAIGAAFGAASKEGANRLAQWLVTRGIGTAIRGLPAYLFTSAGLPLVTTAAAIAATVGAIAFTAGFIHALSNCPMRELDMCRRNAGIGYGRGGGGRGEFTPPGPHGSGVRDVLRSAGIPGHHEQLLAERNELNELHQDAPRHRGTYCYLGTCGRPAAAQSSSARRRRLGPRLVLRHTGEPRSLRSIAGQLTVLRIPPQVPPLPAT